MTIFTPLQLTPKTKILDETLNTLINANSRIVAATTPND